jgi:hypothetical protein
MSIFQSHEWSIADTVFLGADRIPLDLNFRSRGTTALTPLAGVDSACASSVAETGKESSSARDAALDIPHAWRDRSWKCEGPAPREGSTGPTPVSSRSDRLLRI